MLIKWLWPWLLNYDALLHVFVMFRSIFWGFRGKRSKCFFMYIHLRPFLLSPPNMSLRFSAIQHSCIAFLYANQGQDIFFKTQLQSFYQLFFLLQHTKVQNCQQSYNNADSLMTDHSKRQELAQCQKHTRMIQQKRICRSYNKDLPLNNVLCDCTLFC